MDENTSREVLEVLIDTIGTEPRIWRTMDADEKTSVMVASFDDQPERGWTAYSTFSLQDAPNVLNGHDIRVEVLGVAGPRFTWFKDLLGTIGFFVIKDHWVAAPGIVFPRLVSRYYDPQTRFPHVYFSQPQQWDELGEVTLDDGRAVHWLLAVPISDGEYAYLREHGDDAFETLLEEKQVDYFDLERDPAV